MKNFLFVGLGGAVGSMLRYAITLLAGTLHLHATWATLTVNVVGSFLIGLCLSLCTPGTALLFLTVGMCGGFTTFSTFSSQSLNLLQSGQVGWALANIFGTIILCLLAVWAGSSLIKN